MRNLTIAICSTLIGECKIPVNSLKHGNIVDEWFSLTNDSRSAGEINLRMQLAPFQGRAPANAYPGAVATAYAAPAGMYFLLSRVSSMICSLLFTML